MILRSSLLRILGGGEHEQVAHTLRIAPLIVVPRNQLHELVVEHNTSRSIEDARCRVAEEVSRDDALISVGQDTLQGTLSGIFHDLLDVFVACGCLEAYDEVHDRDVQSRNTERKTTAKTC